MAQPVDNEVAQFIRDEIRTLVQDETRPASTADTPSYTPPSASQAQQTQYGPLSALDPANPNYGGAKSAQGPDIQVVREPTNFTSGIGKFTAADSNNDSIPIPTLGNISVSRTGLIMIWSPMVIWLVLVLGLGITKTVPANIVWLAAILTGAMYTIIFILALSVLYALKRATRRGKAQDQAVSRHKIIFGSIFTWHYLLVTIVFSLALWKWFIYGDDSMFVKANLADAFATRLGLGRQGFAAVVSCLGAGGPEQGNVRRAVVDICLKDSGVA